MNTTNLQLKHDTIVKNQQIFIQSAPIMGYERFIFLVLGSLTTARHARKIKNTFIVL